MNHVRFPRVSPRGPPPSQSAPTDAEPRPRKLRRISRACDFCHKRSIRCKPSVEDTTRCQNCLDFGVSCTYNRPAKKRGIKSGNLKQSAQNEGLVDEEQDARMLLELTNGIHGNGTFNVVDKFSIPEKWKSMVLASEGKIRDLMDVYFEVVYPIFPLFHAPTLIRRYQNREYFTDHSLFADTMAICALSSARARDGALFSGRWDPDHFKNPTSESFFEAAKESIPQDLSAMRGLDWMRTCALMALYGIQVGRIEIMHQYLGLYHSLVAMDNLHDEKNWPKSGIVEIELRRRLFWSMYTLEVYSSIIWCGIIRCRESQCNVSYPSEVDDEFFSDQTGYRPQNALEPSNNSQQAGIVNPISWLHGWNFTTELYRILEHAMDDFHRRRPRTSGPFSPGDLFRRVAPHQNVVLEKVMEMHEQLPAQFKDTKLVPQNGKGGLEDKFSFQAANITATLQLVRMVLFTSDEATVDQKCAIARDLLDSFSKVPVFFLKAISSPLLHHLAGIGAILGSVIEGPLSEPSYLQVRGVLLAMADLLASLEAGFNERTHVGAASRLRDQVLMIDKFMADQRQADFPLTHTTHPVPQALPNHGFPSTSKSVIHRRNTSTLSSVSDANIDPSLQFTAPLPGAAAMDASTSVGAGGIYQTTAAPGNAFDFSTGSTVPQSVNSMGGINGAGTGDEQLHFQIPPELLEGWPWPFDVNSGVFGAF